MHQPVLEFSGLGKVTIKVKLTAAQQKKETGTIFGLFLLHDGVAATDPVYCNVQREKDSLFITPASPLGIGSDFEFRLYQQEDTLRKQFAVNLPGDMPPIAEPAHIYPLSEKIPENILLFHVLFSEPMLEDIKAYTHVKILDEKGVEKPRVWREKSTWAQHGKHLVLMIHPGKIKRGIKHMEEDSALFEEGKTYTLVISNTLKDAWERPLEKELLHHNPPIIFLVVRLQVF